MSRSQGAATAIIDAPQPSGASVTPRAWVLGAPRRTPEIGERRASRLVDFTVGQSDQHRSIWESPQRGAFQAACVKRAGMGGRAVRTRDSDGPATDRNGRPCTTRPETDFTQRAG